MRVAMMTASSAMVTDSHMVLVQQDVVIASATAAVAAAATTLRLAPLVAEAIARAVEAALQRVGRHGSAQKPPRRRRRGGRRDLADTSTASSCSEGRYKLASSGDAEEPCCSDDAKGAVSDGAPCKNRSFSDPHPQQPQVPEGAKGELLENVKFDGTASSCSEGSDKGELRTQFENVKFDTVVGARHQAWPS